MQVGRASPARTQTADEPTMCAIAARCCEHRCMQERAGDVTRLPTAALTTSAHGAKQLLRVPCGAVAAALKQTARSQRQGIGSSSDACRSGIASTDSDGADEPAMCAIAAAVSAAACSSELVT